MLRRPHARDAAALPHACREPAHLRAHVLQGPVALPLRSCRRKPSRTCGREFRSAGRCMPPIASRLQRRQSEGRSTPPLARRCRSPRRGTADAARHARAAPEVRRGHDPALRGPGRQSRQVHVNFESAGQQDPHVRAGAPRADLVTLATSARRVARPGSLARKLAPELDAFARESRPHASAVRRASGHRAGAVSATSGALESATRRGRSHEDHHPGRRPGRSHGRVSPGPRGATKSPSSTSTTSVLRELQDGSTSAPSSATRRCPACWRRRRAEADMIVAVTNSDEVNMIACQVAWTLFSTPTRDRAHPLARILRKHRELFGRGPRIRGRRRRSARSSSSPITSSG